MKLHNHIKVRRAMKNISQEELAIAVGVSRKTINTIENGIYVPSTILSIKLARFFGIKVEDLFELTEEEDSLPENDDPYRILKEKSSFISISAISKVVATIFACNY